MRHMAVQVYGEILSAISVTGGMSQIPYQLSCGERGYIELKAVKPK